MALPKRKKKRYKVMRTYHAYRTEYQKLGETPQGKERKAVLYDESDWIYPPTPNAKMDYVQWFDEIVPWDPNDVGTVRILWRIEQEKDDD
jgi:hypothetical protein